MLYELINPSDPVTFLAESDKVALLTAILVGSGKTPATREDGQDIGGMLMFMKEDQIEKYALENFGCSLQNALNENMGPVADALESFLTLSFKGRKMIESAKEFMDEEAYRKYRSKMDDESRTSLNQISERAWSLAKSLRKKIAHTNQP